MALSRPEKLPLKVVLGIIAKILVWHIMPDLQNLSIRAHIVGVYTASSQVAAYWSIVAC